MQDVHDGTFVGIPTTERRWPQQTEYVRKDVAERVTDEMVVAALRQAYDEESGVPGAWDALSPAARAMHLKLAGDATRRLLTAALAACSEGDNDER